ncbi:Pvc16 family protein [Streptomyces sp. MS2.AVA.5]|uniref:Pvc16 family protein n=1 Tax=Streptomyces achmelvichensis TaxID=3134111 RepID=A0ACC6PL95_9ACTN
MNVLQSVDDTLEDELRRGPLHGMNAQVGFETPNADWAARRTGLWVNLFLHSVDEDTPRRQSGDRSIVDEQGIVVGYDLPTRFFRLGYALTVWGQTPRDEHSVLGNLLEWCVRTDRLSAQHEAHPADIVSLRLRRSPEDAEPPAMKLWAGLGTPARPVLDLLVTVPVTTPNRAIDTEPVRGLTLQSHNLQPPADTAERPRARDGVRLRRKIEEIG